MVPSYKQQIAFVDCGMCAAPAQQSHHSYGIWMGSLKNILASKCEANQGVQQLRKLENRGSCVHATGTAENSDAIALPDQISNTVQIAIGRPHAWSLRRDGMVSSIGCRSRVASGVVGRKLYSTAYGSQAVTLAINNHCL
jgi:hypothetical protein